MVFFNSVSSVLLHRTYLSKQPACADLGWCVESSHKKLMLHILCLIGVPHPPTDSITVHHKSLRKYIVKLWADRHSSWKNTCRCKLSESGETSEAFFEVVQNWPQRVSHTIVRDFCSATSTQALKSITCVSHAERVCHDKQCIRLVLDVKLWHPPKLCSGKF